METWKEVQLKDISLKITKGTTPTTMGYEFQEEGVNFIKAESITRVGVIDESTFAFIELKAHESLKRSQIQESDILLTIAGIYLGKVGLIKKHHLPANTNQAVAIIRLDSTKVLPKYLKYFFFEKSTTTYLNQLCPQAAQPNLNLTQLGKLRFKLPPIDVQRKIAFILSSYDDLIENNNRRISILEKMAEEIYREWFIRFRFPGYKSAEFEKGIPKGWTLDRVDSIGKVITGKTPSTENSKYYGGDIHFVKTPDMHDNMFIYETEEKLTEDGLNSQPSQILPANSICVSCIGTGGVVSITTEQCSTNQQINSVVLEDKKDLEWGFFTLKAMKETIKAFGSTGTTMTNLSKGKFSGLRIIVAPKNLRAEFHERIFPVFEQIRAITLLNMNLGVTRDSLLPRLVSGKLSVENLDIQLPPSMLEEKADACR